jgi:Domain of unknown function (DUF4178)
MLDDTQLQTLETGDCLTYRGVQWDVEDDSTYQDTTGYQTAEWLLRSSSGDQYYLIRETDPEDPQKIVYWYLSEEIQNPQIWDSQSLENVTVPLSQAMQNRSTSYPGIIVLHRAYFFESQTEGSYRSEAGVANRLTWDYWDRSHHWNLAIELWPDGKFYVYSTKIVHPEDFSDLQKATAVSTKNLTSPNFISQLIAYMVFLLAGISLLIFG